MIMVKQFNDNLDDILSWLTTRMKPFEKRNFFDELKVKNVEELKECWHYQHVKDRVLLEVQKRTTVADCTFRLEPFSTVRSTKKCPPTFIAMSAKDD